MLLINPYRFAPIVPSEDTDALAYIAAVEAADGQSLEEGVATAFTDFIVGCKSDGIWSALKASCILAGARTLAGALVPLVGSAPTNNNFVSGDYNRETGLKGNGSTKYLDSNRLTNSDDASDSHIAINVTAIASNTSVYAGSIGGSAGANYAGTYISKTDIFCHGWPYLVRSTLGSGFIGGTRSNSTQATYRFASNTTTVNNTTRTWAGDYPYYVFSQAVYNTSLSNNLLTNGRLSFYSFGSNINLAALDSRISTLMTDIAAAIP